MTSQVLASALAKFGAAGELPASRLTPAQARELELFGNRTAAVRKTMKGGGAVFVVANPATVETTLAQLRPMAAEDIPDAAPDRARNIGRRRSSKSGKRRLDAYHLLLRPAPGGGAIWTRGDDVLDLATHTRLTGMAALAVEREDAWQTSGPLWLVENQTNFDDLSWMPEGAQGSVAYYGGIIDGRLLGWLTARRRHGGLILFPDYDGVGLRQYARLAATSANKDLEFWLMPDWEPTLATFGSPDVWRKTHTNFEIALKRLKGTAARYRVLPLIEAMQRLGLALEQEAVWLTSDKPVSLFVESPPTSN